MPLDVLGRTRATLMHSTSLPCPKGPGNLLKLHRDGDRLLQLLIFNEEFLVRPCHQRGLITSLPFVHTARRSYRLNDPVRSLDCGNAAGSPAAMPWEAAQTLSFRGRRSRNKVSVGEPAEGSLAGSFHPHLLRTVRVSRWRRRAQRASSLAVPGPPSPPGDCGVSGAPGARASPPSVAAARLLASRARPARILAGACSPSPDGARGDRAIASALLAPRPPHHELIHTQLLPIDILAPATMKNAAKCDT